MRQIQYFLYITLKPRQWCVPRGFWTCDLNFEDPYALSEFRWGFTHTNMFGFNREN